MNICVRLAPAYPPEFGDPARAAPLEIRITEVHAGRGRDSAALQKRNAILTSVSQLTANSCQLCSCSGEAGGKAPPHRNRVSGWKNSNTLGRAAFSVSLSARTS